MAAFAAMPLSSAQAAATAAARLPGSDHLRHHWASAGLRTQLGERVLLAWVTPLSYREFHGLSDAVGQLQLEQRHLRQLAP